MQFSTIFCSFDWEIIHFARTKRDFSNFLRLWGLGTSTIISIEWYCIPLSSGTTKASSVTTANLAFVITDIIDMTYFSSITSFTVLFSPSLFSLVSFSFSFRCICLYCMQNFAFESKVQSNKDQDITYWAYASKFSVIESPLHFIAKST